MYKGKRAELREASRAKRRNDPRYFITTWIVMLWDTMMKTGKGYKMQSLRNTGKGTDRRADKLEQLGVSRLARQYSNRYPGATVDGFRRAK